MSHSNPDEEIVVLAVRETLAEIAKGNVETLARLTGLSPAQVRAFGGLPPEEPPEAGPGVPTWDGKPFSNDGHGWWRCLTPACYHRLQCASHCSRCGRTRAEGEPE